MLPRNYGRTLRCSTKHTEMKRNADFEILPIALSHIQVTQATGSGVASFACTTDGNLYSWGSSKRGQLGLGREVLSTAVPTKLPDLRNVVQVSAGWGHTLALNGEPPQLTAHCA